MEQTPLDILLSNAPPTKASEEKKKISPAQSIEPSSIEPKEPENIQERENGAYKFSTEEKHEIIAAIACHKSTAEIQRMTKEKFGKTIHFTTIIQYKEAKCWQPMIQKIREEYDARIAEEEFASKRRRVQELSDAYRTLKNVGEITESTNVLTKIRDEIEGKSSGALSVTQYNQYNGLTDDELRKVILENTRFLEIAEKNKALELKAEPDESVEG